MSPPPETQPLAALVTGASRGIGRVVALQLAARGVRVCVHYNANQRAAEAVVADLPGTGHCVVSADLADPLAVERLWQEAQTGLGRVDILVNNAAVHGEHPPLSTGYAEWVAAWRHTLEANLMGPANLSQLAAKAMAASGGGRIVNVSSRGAFRGEPRSPAYGASKAGLNSLSQSMAKELAPAAVLVFCVAPGWVETEMAAAFLHGPGGAEIVGQHPLGRVTSPEEVAKAVVFCALDAPAAMTGAILDVNGASYLRT